VERIDIGLAWTGETIDGTVQIDSSRATPHLKHDYCEWEQGLVKGIVLLVSNETVQEWFIKQAISL
jgi:hypothetical protein